MTRLSLILFCAVALYPALASGQANTIVSDSFTGTAGTALTVHNPTPTGDGYTVHPNNGFWSAVPSVLDGSNRASSNDATDSLMITKETMPTADYEVSADFIMLTNIGNLRQGICLRVDPLNDTMYCAFWNNDGNIYLHRRVAGVTANLQNVALALSPGTHAIKLAVVGTTLTMTVDGVPGAPVVDTNISAAGRVGIWLKEVVSPTTGGRIDNLTVVNTGATALTIVSQTPPVQGTASTPYSRTLASAGGTGAHTWTLDSGTLPTGLSISTGGVVSGTPTTAGLYVYTLKVTDGAAATATKTFRMGVNGPAQWVVPAGGSLQGALDSAVRGDNIDVDNTGTFSGNGFTLAAKSGTCSASSATWIHVRSTALASLPAGRVGPANTSNMPVLKTTDNISGTAAITASSTACGWKLSGLQITNDTTITINEMIVLSTATYITLDRNYIYPKEVVNVAPPYNSTGRIAISQGGANIFITNNDIRSFFGLPPGSSAGATAHDSTGWTYDGPGPGLFQGNRVETWFNGIQLGGSDIGPTNPATISASPAPTLTTATLSSVSGLVAGMPITLVITPWSAAYCKNPITSPCWADGVVTGVVGNAVTYTALVGFDNTGGGSRVTIPGTAAPLVGGLAGWAGTVVSNITIDKNLFHQPTAFAVWQHTNGGGSPNPKSHIEIKMCATCNITGNVFEGYPSNMVAFNGVNQAGSTVQAKISDVTIQNNWAKEYNACIFASLTDAYYINTQGGNISVINNLCTGPDAGGVQTGLNSVFWNSGKGGAAGWIFRHNTAISASTTQHIGPWSLTGPDYSPQAPVGTVFKDNLVPYGDLGMNCASGGIAVCWPTRDEDQNLFVLNVAVPTTPVASQFPNSLTTASFATALLIGTCGPLNAATNCGLQAGSPGKSQGTDGADIGVIIPTLLANCPDCAGPASTVLPAIQGRTVILGRTVH